MITLPSLPVVIFFYQDGVALGTFPVRHFLYLGRVQLFIPSRPAVPYQATVCTAVAG